LLASRVPSPQSLKSDDEVDVLLEVPEVRFSFGFASSLICRGLVLIPRTLVVLREISLIGGVELTLFVASASTAVSHD